MKNIVEIHPIKIMAVAIAALLAVLCIDFETSHLVDRKIAKEERYNLMVNTCYKDGVYQAWVYGCAAFVRNK